MVAVGVDLAGKYLVVWLSPKAVETFLGVPVPLSCIRKSKPDLVPAIW
jgi:hypothetical protein